MNLLSYIHFMCSLITVCDSFASFSLSSQEELIATLLSIENEHTLNVFHEEQMQSKQQLKQGFQAEPEADMNLTQLIEAQGFPVEMYDVTTEDGYILGIARIPYNKNISGGKNKRGTFFIQHALLCSADDWVIQGKKSLPYLLATNGYEVWLGNARGNTYSRKHTTLKPKDPKFWDWTFNEMARYDLPATITHALSVSGDTQVHYVGHSQGTLSAFIAFDRNQELAKKIKEYFALAPVARLNGMAGLFHYMSFLPLYLTKRLFDAFGKGEFLPSHTLIKPLGDMFCRSLTQKICENILMLICGWDQKNFDPKKLPTELAHTPAGSSSKNVIHFALNSRNQFYGEFDYGSPSENKKHYNQTTPPAYGFQFYTVPTTIVYGTEDYLADLDDVSWLITQLGKNLKRAWKIEGFQHLDFIWGVTAKDEVYDRILNALRQ